MFRSKKRNTSSIAKDRLKLLVNAERIDCSPNILMMIRKDLMKTVNKYIIVEEDGVVISYTASPPTLNASITVKQTPHRNKG